MTTHGRGGAGNINAHPHPTTTAEDLQTPTLKQPTYTTGRGGSGNMAHNSSPESARRAQDVEAPAVHSSDPKGTFHWGRGGEGNMVTIGKEEDKEGRTGSGSKERGRSGSGKKERTGSIQHALEKGKEKLGLKGKQEGSAVEDD